MVRLLACIIILLATSARADHITPQEARHLLLWPELYRFLSNWQAEKEARRDHPIAGLLAAHSEPSRNGRVLSFPGDGAGQYTLDRINRLWLNQAMAHLLNRELDEAEHALEQLAEPVHPKIEERRQLLRAMLAQYRGEHERALILYAGIAPDSPLAPLIRYNQALSYRALGRTDEALALLDGLGATSGAAPSAAPAQPSSAAAPASPEGWSLLTGYADLLRARILAEQGHQQVLIDDTAFVEADLALYRQLLMTEASFYRAKGDREQAVRALLELVDPRGDGPLSLHQSWLLQYLYELSASAQAANLSAVWIESLMRQLELQYDASKSFADPDFEKQLNQRRSGDNGSALVAFSRETRGLIQDLERVNSLIELVKANLRDMREYRSLFERGRAYIVSQILQNPELAPRPPLKLPDSVQQQAPEIRALELSLSELVGSPDPWQTRYQLLDGLSIWVKGQPFPYPWWKQPVNPSLAAEELDLHLRQRRALVEDLNVRATRERTAALAELEPRARELLKRLEENRLELSRALAESLRTEPERVVRQTEQALLWLTARATPKLDDLGKRESVRFRVVSRNGKQELVREPAGKPLPDLSTIYKALRLLQERGRNRDIAWQAQRHLADLTLMLAESFEIEGRQSPDPMIRFERAIELYEPLLQDEQNLQHPDQVLYQLARAHDLAGQRAQALAVLERLQRDYPDSAYIQEVGFRIGEMRFALGDYDLAADQYRRLLEDPAADQWAERAQYKLGWSLLKSGDNAGALEQFFPLVDRYWAARHDGSEESRRLLADVLRVIAMTFAYQEGAKSVDDWFRSHGDKPYAERIYADLGAYYARKKRFSDAAETFEALVARYPQSENAPYYQSRVVAAYSDGGFPLQAWPARERFVERFGPASAYWREADETRRGYVRRYLPAYLRDLGQRDHARAQQSKAAGEKAKLYAQAIGWYRRYLEAMPDDPARPEIAFYLGEALTETGRHEQAAEAYLLAAYGEGTFARRSDAAHAALLAYQTLYNSAAAADEKQHWLALGIKESRRFVSSFPSAPQAAEIATKLAEDYLLADDYGAAREVAAVQLEQNPGLKPDMALRLWRVRAHAAFALALWQEAEESYLAALRLPVEPRERAEFRTRAAEAIYKQGETARDRAGDPIAAINHFLRVGHVIPEARIRPVAEFDAAALLIAEKRWPEAIRVLEQFRKAYPDHELQATVPDKLVVAYEATQQWAKASFYLDLIYQREKDSALGREALWRSAELQQKAGDITAAARIYARYVSEYPEPLEEAMDAREILVRLADEAGQPRVAESWLDSMVRAVAGAESPSDRSLLLASRAGLRLARSRAEAFEKVALKLPLDKTLARKRALLEQAVGYLNQVLDFGLAEPSTYATLMLGDLYRHLSQALMNSERPTGLDELAREQYDILLEEQALPFEDQALQFYETNLRWISEGIYTPGIAQTLERLRVLMPARYDKPERVPDYVEAID